MMPSEYRPEIDGLRAIAVLSVLFFHARFTGFPGGFVGVDVFFVISGYLITGIIHAEIARTGRFSLSGFYVRRVRRLFPALFFTLALSAVAAALLFSPDDLRRFAASAIATLLSISNFHFWLESDYFDAAAELKPLLHTWSLSVEEQFYLVWPSLLALLAALGWMRHAPKIVGILLLAGLALAWSLQADRAMSFYLAPFRVYEFAIGAALVWLPRPGPRSGAAADAAVIAGLALIGFGVVVFDAETPFPALNALLPCLGAALCIWGANSGAGRILLGNRLAVGLGLISYSLYLIHWPLLVFAKYFSVFDLTPTMRVGLCMLSIALAAGMYRWIEQPFRLRGQRLRAAGSRRFFAVAAACVLLLVLPLADAWRTGGWPHRIDRDYDNAPAYAGATHRWEELLSPDGATRGTIVLFGDSHAKQYVGSLQQAANGMDYALRTITHGACMSLPTLTNVYQGTTHDDCRQLYRKLLDIRRPNLVVLAYRWPKLLSVDGAEEPLDGKNESPENLDRYLDAVLAGISGLLSELGDVPVIMIGNVPSARLPHGFPSCADRPFHSAACHESFRRADGEFAHAIARFRAFAEASGGRVRFLDPYDSLCDAATCYVVRNRTLYYSDHAHLTVEAAERVVRDNQDLIANALERRLVTTQIESRP